MIELKEKELEIHTTTYEGKESFCLILNWRGVHTEEETKKLRKQILDDYEKAREFEKIGKEIHVLHTEWREIFPEIKQKQKLGELIAKRIRELKVIVFTKHHAVDPEPDILKELQKIWEDSKNG